MKSAPIQIYNAAGSAYIDLYAGGFTSNYIRHKAPSSITTSFDLTWPNALPVSTQAIVVSNTGTISYQTVGTVTSVGLSMPAIFTVGSSPITSSGTLSVTLASQSANTVWAAPDGSSGSPSFRSLVADDIPSLTAAKISNFDTQVRTSRLDQMASPTSSVSYNNQRITNLLDPSSQQDAATKAYVDSVATGLVDVKSSVRVATTSNITLSGTQTIDGVSVIAGDRVLVKDQSTGSQNGIYVCASGTWSRALDADSSSEMGPGVFAFVEEGTTNADTGWVLSTNAPITLDTTSLTFTQFSAAGQVVAGSGLTKTGSTLDVNVDNSTIEISGNNLRVKDSGITNAKIASSTIDLTTKVTGNLPVANGGTGSNTASGARSNLSAAGIYKTSFTNASLVAGSLTVTHNLAQYCNVTIIDNNNKQLIPDDITFSSATQLVVDVTSFGTLTGTWQIVVVG